MEQPTLPQPPALVHAAFPEDLLPAIRQWAAELGLADVRVCDVDLEAAGEALHAWLAQGFHGDMHYMAAHGTKRYRPAELVPGTVRVLSVRMPYLPASHFHDWRTRELQRDEEMAKVSIYARGRDYHKVLRARLQTLAERIAGRIGPFGYRVFTDSAPVMEVAIAEKSGLGWRGKHSLLLHRSAGSMFFLGEIYLDLPLPVDPPVEAHCGACTRCMDACPTGAIVAPYEVDARRCISYLTIELHGPIPEELRPLIGTHIYGCDLCQLHCPWNKFAQVAAVPDFAPRNGLEQASLLELFSWDEAAFLQLLEGSPIRRIGHLRWLRNLAVALGNLARSRRGDPQIMAALQARLTHPDALVQEHVRWALAQHGAI